MVNASRELVETVDGISYATLPSEVIDKAKKLILDTIGCAIAATDSEPGRIVQQYAQSAGGDQATILGSTEKVSTEKAALVNCTYARYLDLNDTGRSWNGEGGHPSGHIPLALAVGEQEHADGKQLIESIVAGYEVQMLMYDFPVVSVFQDIGWDHTSGAHYSTPMVAGKLMGLTRKELLNALGISGSFVVLSELRSGNISMMKAPAFGFAAERGIEAASLARGGLTGPQKIIEGERGYTNLVAGDGDLSLFADPPEYRIERSCIKQFPTAYITHAPIQATIEIVSNHDVQPEEVDTIDVHTFEWLIEDMVDGMGDTPRTNPDTRETADHSLPYVLAVAAIDRELGMDQFTLDRIRSDDVREMMKRISFHVDEQMDERYPEIRPARIELTTTAGETYTNELDYPKGDPRDPLHIDDVERKFRSITSRYLTEEQQTAVVEIVKNFEDQDDISEIFEHLVLQDA